MAREFPPPTADPRRAGRKSSDQPRQDWLKTRPGRPRDQGSREGEGPAVLQPARDGAPPSAWGVAGPAPPHRLPPRLRPSGWRWSGSPSPHPRIAAVVTRRSAKAPARTDSPSGSPNLAAAKSSANGTGRMINVEINAPGRTTQLF